MKKKNIVLIGGGVGSSTFTKAVKDLPVHATTIVSAFDDGGSTGAFRRDYGGVALGDFRQCVVANLELDEKLIKAINHRFGRGALFGVNTGNLFLRAFLDQYENTEEGVQALHVLLGLKNQVVPISYDFARLCARLSNCRELTDQQQINDHFSFVEASIQSLSLKPRAEIAPQARKAMRDADYLCFAPGNFFSSVLPHCFVDGFARAWKTSRAKKIWFVNLLAHRGQDSFYTLRDYLRWFERTLGPRPFDMVVINEDIPRKTLNMVKDRFEKVKVVEEDLNYLKSRKVNVVYADLVSLRVRAQEKNDTIMRAPLRHDVPKIRSFFKTLLKNGK